MGTTTSGHNRLRPVRAPGLTMLRGYRRAWLRGDLIAGVTVAAYLVPQVMAYAGVAGLPPVTGLWAALAPLACYALLGSSRLVSLGPESTTALMTAVAIGPLAAGNPARYAALAATLALLVGLLAVVAWLVRLGFLADLLSRPVLVGYLAGVALIMIAGQLGRLTGVQVTGESFIAQVISFAGRLAQVNSGDIVIAAAVLMFLFTAQSRWPRLPGPLAAVLLSTAVCAIFGLGRHGVALVGYIPAGLPTPGLPKVHLSDVRELILPALGVLLVAFSDVVLTGRAFERGGESIDANQELLALGVSKGLSVAELLWRVGRPHDAIQGLVPGMAGMHDVDDYPQAETIPGLVVYRYDAPLFFANAQDFRRRALTAAGSGPGRPRWFILNTEANVEVDFTALEAVEAVRAELGRRGTIFALARVKQDLLDDLVAFGLAEKIGEQRIFPTLPTAVAAYRQWASQHPLSGPGAMT